MWAVDVTATGGPGRLSGGPESVAISFDSSRHPVGTVHRPEHLGDGNNWHDGAGTAFTCTGCLRVRARGWAPARGTARGQAQACTHSGVRYAYASGAARRYVEGGVACGRATGQAKAHTRARVYVGGGGTWLGMGAGTGQGWAQAQARRGGAQASTARMRAHARAHACMVRTWGQGWHGGGGSVRGAYAGTVGVGDGAARKRSERGPGNVRRARARAYAGAGMALYVGGGSVCGLSERLVGGACARDERWSLVHLAQRRLSRMQVRAGRAYVRVLRTWVAWAGQACVQNPETRTPIGPGAATAPIFVVPARAPGCARPDS
ncbi:hypothetical protein GGX14DRAFT_403997 [Mycena pura]|uniref:Uncharacterized protein n=1 Tax=Mycena pura TaxID=153505 RepID=A0AAD6UZC1_9AGAR|nr:hypothetical protein GGX14DRAFT_403997 [Mycena pura]